MENKNVKPYFGRGFRSVSVVPEVSIFPSQRLEEICASIDPVESFRIERDSDDPDACIRVRSDISMLLHAADIAKKIGPAGLQYLMNTKRTKTSSVQSRMDELNLSDDEILSTIKSRHLQHPSEILAWVDSINEIADEMKSEALKQIAYEKEKTVNLDDSSVGLGSSSTVES